MNIQPAVPILPANSDGPTFPLEVSTDRYYYPLGVDVDIILANVGEKHIVFRPTPVDLYIVDSTPQVIVDTTSCPKTNAEVRIYNIGNYLYSMEWDERYLICDENGDLKPPSGEEVPLGEYTISAGSDSAWYGYDPMPIWDSVSIEIGSGNPPPVADAGPDQTVYVGDIVHFNGSWSSDPNAGWNRVTVDSVGDVGSWASLALDKHGNPHMSYYDSTNESLKYANLTSNDWTIEILDSDGVDHGSTSIALDQMDRPHVSYYAKNELRHANWTGSEWSIDIVDTDGDVGMYSSLALDSLGYPHISYFANLLNNLKYAMWNGTAWSTETVDSNGAVGRHTSIAINKSDQPHISYQEYDPNYDLKYAYRFGNRWYIETVDSEGATGLWTSLALDRRGDPHISYFRSDLNQDKYAKQTWNTWHIETVHDDLIVSGMGGSLALDSWDHPHMAYTDSYPNDGAGLEYSEWTKDGWKHEFADLGDARHISLALDMYDNPHLGYYAHEKGDLKYATLSDRIIEYYWDFGDGSPHRTGLKPTHIYSSPGVYNATLRVTDNLGAVDTDNCIITVLERVNQQPVADADGPYYVDEGSPATLDGSGSNDPDNDSLYYRWDLDNDGVWDTNWSPNPTTTNTWMDDGIYTVVLQVKDTYNETDVVNGTVYVGDLAPTAGFSWSPDPQDEGSPIQFTDQSISHPDALVSWSWEFGDGGNSSNQNAAHAYGDNGIYAVILTVTDDDGSTDAMTDNVTILNVAPTPEWTSKSKDGATLNPPYPEGKEIQFQASVDDPGIYDTFTYDWDFGDGTVLLDADPSVTHAYGDNDTYTVVLTVTDDDGGVGIDDTPPLEIYNVDPDGELHVPFCMFFEGSPGCDLFGTFSDPGWLDTHIVYWEFGDGLTDDQVPVEENEPPEATGNFTMTHMYGDDGKYEVNATVIDDDGGEETSQIEIQTMNVAPSLSVSKPSTIDEGQSVSVTVNATDPGSDDIYLVLDWGDGISEKRTYYNDGVGPDPPQSPLGNYPFNVTETFTHVYGDNGVYEAKITVTDDDGGETNESFNITVLNVAPSITAFGPFTVDEGTSLAFNATSTDPGSDDLTFTWKFEMGPTISRIYYNDGAGPDPYPSPGGTFPFTVTDTVKHTYGDNGVYNVTLTVEDDDGGTTRYSTTITVDNVAPTVDVQAYVLANFTLRIAGEKWHNVEMFIYADGEEIGYAEVVRYPGNPDEQTASTGYIKCDITRTITAKVLYTPNDDPINGQINGANPVWLALSFEDGSEVKLKHTFNVQHPDTWEWNVNVNPYLVGHEITFEATATDPGSDDLTFTWNWGDGSPENETTYYNDGTGPDPYPSPGGTYPFIATDMQKHTFRTSGVYAVTLTVEDDDGGIGVAVITLVIP